MYVTTKRTPLIRKVPGIGLQNKGGARSVVERAGGPSLYRFGPLMGLSQIFLATVVDMTTAPSVLDLPERGTRRARVKQAKIRFILMASGAPFAASARGHSLRKGVFWLLVEFDTIKERGGVGILQFDRCKYALNRHFDPFNLSLQGFGDID